MKNLKIAVIGSGYTGLVAALKLAEQGFNVTVFEKSNVVGGLASDFNIEGASLERAYHHIFKTDTDIISMANELGVGNKIKWHDSSVAIYYNNTLYPFKGAMDLIKFKPLNLINRIRAGLVVIYLQKTNNWKRFESISAYDWMLKYAGKQVMQVIWEPLLLGKFNKYYNDVSMAWLWARIHIRAQSRESSGEKLGYFEGGFQVFTDALIAKCKELGVTINVDTNIESIQSLDNGNVGLSVNGSSKTYDRLIATVPSYVFADLISNKNVDTVYKKQLNKVNYLGARLLIFTSNQKISDYYWHNINDVNLPFLVFINHTKLIDKNNYGNKYVYYIATYVPHEDKLFTMSDKELELLWLKSLKKVFPKFNQKQLDKKYHFKFANAQHIVDVNYTNKIPKHITPLKNVYLSNFSQIYPEDRGTNYAVKAGTEIAKIVNNSNRY
jgi:protoporphyrinogen oxidase